MFDAVIGANNIPRLTSEFCKLNFKIHFESTNDKHHVRKENLDFIWCGSTAAAAAHMLQFATKLRA